MIAGFSRHIASSDRPTQAIANFIYGLGLLSQRGTLIQADFSDLMIQFEKRLIYATEWKSSVACLYAGIELLKQSNQLTTPPYEDLLKKKHEFVSIRSKQKQDDDSEFNPLRI